MEITVPIILQSFTIGKSTFYLGKVTKTWTF